MTGPASNSWLPELAPRGTAPSKLVGPLATPTARVTAREAATRTPDINFTWTEAAARLALARHSPRAAGTLPAIEIAQLPLASAASALFLSPLAFEWVTQHTRAAVALSCSLDCLPSGSERVMSESASAITRRAPFADPCQRKWVSARQAHIDVHRRQR
jgi:hypothetical protein